MLGLKTALDLKTTLKIKRLLLPLAAGMVLTACGGSSNNGNAQTPEPVPPPPTVEYQVTVSNLTNAQPLSPVTVVLHQQGNLWQIGQPASAMLEALAESGDNSALLSSQMVLAGAAHDGILPPGEQVQVSVTTTDENAVMLSLATMLVNTNDGFSGLNAVMVHGLAVGDSLSFNAPVYDAGTEGNSEMPGTIPGPADGGEAFNAARDDVDYVALHPGVVGSDDGLTDSVLTSMHKFDNPAVKVTISRLQ